MRVHRVGEGPKIVVAGIPRTGTRYVTNKLGGKPFKRVHEGIIKTHGLAPPEMIDDPLRPLVANALLKNRYRAIFMFGDPIASIISTINNIYDGNHFNNCGCKLKPKDCDITKFDYLNYELMFDSWVKKHQYPTMCIRYEKLPTYEKEFCDFTGVDVSFSDWKERKTKVSRVDEETLERIKLTYANLIEKVNQAKDFYLFN